MADQVLMIPLVQILENEAALRSVDRKSEDFLALVGSVKAEGILNSITVSPIEDTDPQQYRLIDGLQRYSAAQDAGLETIPALVRSMDEEEAFVAQILCNAHKIETKPAEYASHLNRVLSGNPTMTMTELAGKLSKSVTWLNGMLKLNRLADSIKPLVNDGKVNLTNAQALAKLPVTEQMDFLEMAQTQSPQEFVPKINERAKAIRKAAREGKEPGEATFTPTPHLRKLAEVKELRTDDGPIRKAMADAGATDGIKFTLDFLLQMDPESVKVQEAQEEERKAKKKADAEKRKVERDEQKAKKAAEEAEKSRKDYEAKQEAEKK